MWHRNKAPYAERIGIIIDNFDAEDFIMEIAVSMDKGATFDQILEFIEEELGIEARPKMN